jgi:hypothetical protein
MKKLTCAGAKQFDLVEYLASLGHHPQAIVNRHYWYRSQLRDEKTASLKANRKQNIWYDHSLGKGCDLLDLGTLYFKCTIKELRERLAPYWPSLDLSFHPPLTGPPSAGEKKKARGRQIFIAESHPLADIVLLDYFKERSKKINTY